MRPHNLILLVVITLLPATLEAQHGGTHWTLTLSLARESFSGASTDTTTIPGTKVRVFPAPRLATELGLERGLGEWDLWLGAGYAGGDLRASTDLLTLDDRTTSVNRFRASALVGRRIAGFERASLRLVGGPMLDHWRASGIGNRTTLGLRVGLALRLPLGPVEFENRILFGLAPSPFQKADLPPEATVESLRTWSLGVGLRMGL